MTTPDKAILQRNTRRNLIRTLEDFSDRGRQEQYKHTVPFVHVPRELIAQWGDFSRLLKDRRDWFIESLQQPERLAMEAFDAEVESFPSEKGLPDVPEIFDMTEWVRLMHEASLLLSVLNSG